MSSTIISIIVSYIVLGFLLLVFNLRTKFHWAIKALMIVSVTFFYIQTYHSFKEILGWPTKDTLPDRFRLVSQASPEETNRPHRALRLFHQCKFPSTRSFSRRSMPWLPQRPPL